MRSSRDEEGMGKVCVRMARKQMELSERKGDERCVRSHHGWEPGQESFQKGKDKAVFSFFAKKFCKRILPI